MKTLYYFFLLLLPFTCLQAHSSSSDKIVVKQFRLKGFDPETQSTYTGHVIITKEGKVYNALWTFDDGEVNLGTGVRKDDQISFAYVDNTVPPTVIGVQVYEIEHHHLKGPWTTIGSSLVGTETLEEIGSGHHCH